MGLEDARARVARGADTWVVPIGQLREGAFNPRRLYRRVKELGESMLREGQLDPLVVRPVPGQPAEQKFEIADGTRRFRAAQLVGIPELRVEVRPLTDREMVVASLCSNGDREDFHPLEEAAGFRKLVELGASVAEVAARMGVTPARVYSRIALADLVEPIRVAFERDAIGALTALQLARLAPNLQERVWNDLVARAPIVDGGVQITEAEVRGYIGRNVAMRLALAPFPRSDAKLLSNAGTCDACPKQTRNQLQLFELPETEAEDRCLDPACWSQKREAQVERLRARAAATIGGRDARALFVGRTPTLAHDAGYLDLDQPLPQDDADKRKPLDKVIGPVKAWTLVVDPDGNPRRLVEAKVAAEALRAAGEEGLADRIPVRRSGVQKVDQKAKLAEHRERVGRIVDKLGEGFQTVAAAIPPMLASWFLFAAVKHASHEAIAHAFRRRRPEHKGPLPSRQELEAALFPGAAGLEGAPVQFAAGVELLSTRNAWGGGAPQSDLLVTRALAVLGIKLTFAGDLPPELAPPRMPAPKPPPAKKQKGPKPKVKVKAKHPGLGKARVKTGKRPAR